MRKKETLRVSGDDFAAICDKAWPRKDWLKAKDKVIETGERFYIMAYGTKIVPDGRCKERKLEEVGLDEVRSLIWGIE